jgi:hypothetical protein
VFSTRDRVTSRRPEGCRACRQVSAGGDRSADCSACLFSLGGTGQQTAVHVFSAFQPGVCLFSLSSSERWGGTGQRTAVHVFSALSFQPIKRLGGVDRFGDLTIRRQLCCCHRGHRHILLSSTLIAVDTACRARTASELQWARGRMTVSHLLQT